MKDERLDKLHDWGRKSATLIRQLRVILMTTEERQAAVLRNSEKNFLYASRAIGNKTYVSEIQDNLMNPIQ
jgi:Fe-S cluster biosynthesis and repair protein YggX